MSRSPRNCGLCCTAPPFAGSNGFEDTDGLRHLLAQEPGPLRWGRAAAPRPGSLPRAPESPAGPSCSLASLRWQPRHTAMGERERTRHTIRNAEPERDFRRHPKESLTHQCDSGVCALAAGTLGFGEELGDCEVFHQPAVPDDPSERTLSLGGVGGPSVNRKEALRTPGDSFLVLQASFPMDTPRAGVRFKERGRRASSQACR